MGWLRRESRSARIERLRSERAQLLAELESVENEAAWLALGDTPAERAEARRWAENSKALRSALDRLDTELFKLELEELDTL